MKVPNPAEPGADLEIATTPRADLEIATTLRDRTGAVRLRLELQRSDERVTLTAPADGSEPEGDRKHATERGRRHSRQQLSGLTPAPLSPPDFASIAAPIPLDWAYVQYRVTQSGSPPLASSHAGNALIGANLYLFNVVVALEWTPSPATIEMLLHAFKGASDTLYDATNGTMVIGQVTFAGPALMDRADIQMMASNRFHPRSMVNGLHDSKKFSPIRLGRGVWLKKSHTLLPWTEPFAYRAIAHEWAHYALGLHDEYLDDTRTVATSPREPSLFVDHATGAETVVVPRIRLSVETLMETLDASELVPLQHDLDGVDEAVRERILNRMRDRFPEVEAALARPNPGPYQFPGAFPQFYTLFDQDTTAPEEEIEVQLAGIGLAYAWLYTLGERDGKRNIITQGALDDRARPQTIGAATLPGKPFQLLGARPGDTLLAVGLLRKVGKPEGFATRIALVPDADGQAAWGAASPAGGSVKTWAGDEVYDAPVVSVIPRASTSADLAQLAVDVRVVGASGVPTVSLSETGRHGLTRLAPRGAGLYGRSSSAHLPITSLDGIVLLESGGKDRYYWVAEYSHGGNPPTTVRSPGAPISAGSSDGNLMIFTRMEEVPDPPQPDDYKHQVVTTRNFAGFERGRPGRPAGYLFSVASRISLKDDLARLRPTLVLYYDEGALQHGKELALFRYDEARGRWQRLPAYIPPGAFYVATPITAETAPSLAGVDRPDGLYLEHYRLFLV